MQNVLHLPHSIKTLQRSACVCSTRAIKYAACTAQMRVIRRPHEFRCPRNGTLSLTALSLIHRNIPKTVVLAQRDTLRRKLPSSPITNHAIHGCYRRTRRDDSARDRISAVIASLRLPTTTYFVLVHHSRQQGILFSPRIPENRYRPVKGRASKTLNPKIIPNTKCGC